MKKTIFLITLFLIAITLTTVSAETYSYTLPGGKNYLNPENMEVDGVVMRTIEPIYVKQNQTYTLSFPDYDLLGDNIYAYVVGEHQIYIDEYPNDSLCTYDDNRVVCTFMTTADETGLYIEIQGNFMSMYYEYYQYDYFQLEEGPTHTEFEDYISPYVDTTSPTFDGSGAFIASYNSNMTTQDIISSHIIAMDEIDGDLTSQIQIVSDQYSGNEAIVGDYLVELSVADSSGNESTFDLYVLVKDEIAPTIDSPNDIIVSVDQLRFLNDIISSEIVYQDAYDPDPSLQVLVDEYTSNERIVGDYNVAIEVEDDYQNKTSKSFVIHVEDLAPPVLHSSNMLVVNVDSPKSVEEIIASLDITDNYDTSVNIEVINDYYSGNESVTGIYFVDLNLVDDSLNTTEVTVTIAVSDTGNPVIDGPSTLTTSYTETLSPDQIKQLFTVTDNYEVLENTSLSIISDTYSSNGTVPGEYSMTLEVTDSNGNRASHNLIITVIDDIAPSLYIDQFIVVVENGSTFGEGDMMRLLRLSNELDEQDYQIEILQDEYKGNETIPGNYLYRVQLTDSNGKETIRDFNITVPQVESELDYKKPIIYTSIGVMIIVAAIVYKKMK